MQTYRHDSTFVLGWNQYSSEPPPSIAPYTNEQIHHALMSTPSGLRELHIRYTDVEELPPLQDSIEAFELTRCPRLHHIQQLPLCLQICRLYDLGHITLPPLPASLLELYISNSEVMHSVTQLPPQLRVLIVCNDPSNITTLPPLPTTLQTLTLENSTVTTLPSTLPPSLTTLIFFETNVSALPPLPVSLGLFAIKDSPITVLPPLPPALDLLVYPPSQLLLTREPGEFLVDYEARWIPVRERVAEEESRLRCVSRCRVVKEALMVRTWRPEWMTAWCLDEEEKAEWHSNE